MHAKILMIAALLAVLATARPAMAAAESHDLGHGNASASLESPAAFSTDLAIYTFIVFMAVLLILSQAAWPSISKALVEREERINSTIAMAEAKLEEAKSLLAQHEARLANSADEVRAIVEEGRRDAEATKEQILVEARAAAEQERERAIRDIELAANNAMQRLAERSAESAIDLAGRVIRESITPKKQSELVRLAMTQLAAPSEN